MPAYAESMLANDSLEMDFYYRMCSTSKRYVHYYQGLLVIILLLMSPLAIKVLF